MRRLAFWGAVCVGGIALQLAVTLWFLVPYFDGRWYTILWRATDGNSGWRALTPYYAWPILVTYGGALVVLGGVVAVAIGCSIVLRERQAIARREAAVGLQEEQVRIAMAESERIRKGARNQVQEASEEVARCKQETAEQIQAAEFRLQRSVDTNIGLRRQIQGLKKRVNGQGEQGTMDPC